MFVHLLYFCLSAKSGIAAEFVYDLFDFFPMSFWHDKLRLNVSRFIIIYEPVKRKLAKGMLPSTMDSEYRKLCFINKLVWTSEFKLIHP